MEKKRQMEQSATSSSSLLASATVDEIIVSQILLDLKNLMSLSESLSGFNWGRRRRRSCLEAPPELTSACSSLENRIEERRIKVEEAEDEKKHGGGARTTASPDTPLSFSPSESDEKPKHSSKKTSKKRSREEYLDMIEGLSQCKELLTGEIENVSKYYNNLKAQNSHLKALKRQVLDSRRYLGNETTQHYRIDAELHHQPSTSNPTAKDCGHYLGPIAAQLDDRFGRGGPLGIDLNLPAEEAFAVDLYRPLDVNRAIADKRARFAEARRKRIGIIIKKTMKKTKSSRTMG